VAITDQTIDQVYSDLRRTSGGHRNDYFALLYLMQEFGIERDIAIEQVVFGGNDYGVDGFHFDAAKRNFYLFQFKWSSSYEQFKPSFTRLGKVTNNIDICSVVDCIEQFVDYLLDAWSQLIDYARCESFVHQAPQSSVGWRITTHHLQIETVHHWTRGQTNLGGQSNQTLGLELGTRRKAAFRQSPNVIVASYHPSQALVILEPRCLAQTRIEGIRICEKRGVKSSVIASPHI
jgi:hypothetical protein